MTRGTYNLSIFLCPEKNGHKNIEIRVIPGQFNWATSLIVWALDEFSVVQKGALI